MIDLVGTQWRSILVTTRFYFRAVRVVVANLQRWWELFWEIVEELDRDI